MYVWVYRSHLENGHGGHGEFPQAEGPAKRPRKSSHSSTPKEVTLAEPLMDWTMKIGDSWDVFSGYHGIYYMNYIYICIYIYIYIYDVAVATNGNMSQPTKIYGRVGLAMVWCWWFDAQSGHLLVFDVSQAKGGGRGKGRPKNEAPPHRPYEVSSGCVQRLLSHDYVNHMLSMTNWDLYYQ